MSSKGKRKGAGGQAVTAAPLPQSKKAKLSHPPSAIAAASAVPVNKAQKKFERKQQAALKGNKSHKYEQSSRNRRKKDADERPIKVPREAKSAVEDGDEFEWDSDPIQESDTGEESGEDDGVSWPGDSDAGADGYDEPMEDEGFQEDDEGGAGGVSLSTAIVSDQANEAKSNGTSSRESHIKQKELLKERRAAKPNADEIARSKKLWERLRRSSHVPKDERKKLIAELFSLITGRVREFVLKHDAGRVIQTALKYGIPEQRKMIARELAGEMATLAESKYAKFMIGKLVSYGDKEIRDLVVPDFYGKVRRMIRHPEASWILDDIYRGAANKEQKARLLREWYGAEFALFAGKDGDSIKSAELSEVLKKSPEKRKHIMRYLWEMINQLVQKKTTGFTMLHDAMLQYYLNTEPGSEEANEFLELLKGDEEYDLLKNLAFTPAGSRIVCLALAYGTAKDRKLLLRAYKDTMTMMAFDPVAHQVLITACEVIDDTVLVAKSIFSELLPKDIGKASEQQVADAVALAGDVNAREVLLLPFVSRATAVLRREDHARLSEIHTIRETTSKKEPAIRKQEFVKALSPLLLQLIEHKAADLSLTSFGCIFVTEVLTQGVGDKSAALAAISQLASSEDEATQAALATPAGGKMLKTLVQGGRFDFEAKRVVTCEPRLHFVDLLYDQLGLDRTVEWATSAMTFVVLAMLETDDWLDVKKQEKLETRLKSAQKQLKALAKEASSSGGKSNNAAATSAKKNNSNNDKDAAAKSRNDNQLAARGAEKILEALAL